MSSDLRLSRGSIDQSGVSVLSGDKPSVKPPTSKPVDGGRSKLVSSIEKTAKQLGVDGTKFAQDRGKYWLSKYEKQVVANVSAMTSTVPNASSQIALQLFEAYKTKGFSPDGSLTQEESLAQVNQLIANLALEHPIAGPDFGGDVEALKQAIGDIARKLQSAVEVSMPGRLDLATARQMVEKALVSAMTGQKPGTSSQTGKPPQTGTSPQTALQLLVDKALASAIKGQKTDTSSQIALQLCQAYKTEGFSPDGSLTQGESLAKVEELYNKLAAEKPMAGANFERDFDALKQDVARTFLSAVKVLMPTDKLDLATARQMVDKALFLAKFPLNKFSGPKFDRDLTTPQQQKAVKTAFACSSAMMLQEAQKKESVFGKMDPGYDKRFSDMFGVLADYVQKAKTGQADVRILKEIKGLLDKGFNPVWGGIGRFAEPKDATDKSNFSNWNFIGFKTDEGLGSAANQQALGILEKMLDYYGKNVADHAAAKDKTGDNFSLRDLRAGQFHSTIGQIVNDILLNDGLSETERSKFKKSLIEKGVIQDVPAKLQGQLRGSPLLMEIDNEPIADSIAKKALEPLRRFWTRDTTQQRSTNLLTRALLRTTAAELDTISGRRGRFNQIRNYIAIYISSRGGGIEKNCMNMPDARIDEIALGMVEELANTKDDKEAFAILKKRVTSGELFKHSFRPNNVAQRLMTLPDVFRDLVGGKKVDPTTRQPLPPPRTSSVIVGALDGELRFSQTQLSDLQLKKGRLEEELASLKERFGSVGTRLRSGILSSEEAQIDRNKIDLKEKEIEALDRQITLCQEDIKDLKDLRASCVKNKTAIDATGGSYKDIVVKDKQGRTHTLDQLKDEQTTTKMMHDRGHRTICSISGTTTDIGLAIVAQLGEDKVKEATKWLVDFAKDGSGKPEDLKKFKELFTTISLFMQGGQYHTPAEVLGGLLMVGAALHDPQMAGDAKAMEAAYVKLLDKLAANPEDLCIVGDQQRKDFQSQIKKTGTTLVTEQQKKIQEWAKTNDVRLWSPIPPPKLPTITLTSPTGQTSTLFSPPPDTRTAYFDDSSVRTRGPRPDFRDDTNLDIRPRAPKTIDVVKLSGLISTKISQMTRPLPQNVSIDLPIDHLPGTKATLTVTDQGVSVDIAAVDLAASRALGREKDALQGELQKAVVILQGITKDIGGEVNVSVRRAEKPVDVAKLSDLISKGAAKMPSTPLPQTASLELPKDQFPEFPGAKATLTKTATGVTVEIATDDADASVDLGREKDALQAALQKTISGNVAVSVRWTMPRLQEFLKPPTGSKEWKDRVGGEQEVHDFDTDSLAETRVHAWQVQSDRVETFSDAPQVRRMDKWQVFKDIVLGILTLGFYRPSEKAYEADSGHKGAAFTKEARESWTALKDELSTAKNLVGLGADVGYKIGQGNWLADLKDADANPQGMVDSSNTAASWISPVGYTLGCGKVICEYLNLRRDLRLQLKTMEDFRVATEELQGATDQLAAKKEKLVERRKVLDDFKAKYDAVKESQKKAPERVIEIEKRLAAIGIERNTLSPKVGPDGSVSDGSVSEDDSVSGEDQAPDAAVLSKLAALEEEETELKKELAAIQKLPRKDILLAKKIDTLVKELTKDVAAHTQAAKALTEVADTINSNMTAFEAANYKREKFNYFKFEGSVKFIRYAFTAVASVFKLVVSKASVLYPAAQFLGKITGVLSLVSGVLSVFRMFRFGLEYRELGKRLEPVKQTIKNLEATATERARQIHGREPTPLEVKAVYSEQEVKALRLALATKKSLETQRRDLRTDGVGELLSALSAFATVAVTIMVWAGVAAGAVLLANPIGLALGALGCAVAVGLYIAKARRLARRQNRAADLQDAFHKLRQDPTSETLAGLSQQNPQVKRIVESQKYARLYQNDPTKTNQLSPLQVLDILSDELAVDYVNVTAQSVYRNLVEELEQIGSLKDSNDTPLEHIPPPRKDVDGAQGIHDKYFAEAEKRAGGPQKMRDQFPTVCLLREMGLSSKDIAELSWNSRSVGEAVKVLLGKTAMFHKAGAKEILTETHSLSYYESNPDLQDVQLQGVAEGLHGQPFDSGMNSGLLAMKANAGAHGAAFTRRDAPKTPEQTLFFQRFSGFQGRTHQTGVQAQNLRRAAVEFAGKGVSGSEMRQPQVFLDKMIDASGYPKLQLKEGSGTREVGVFHIGRPGVTEDFYAGGISGRVEKQLKELRELPKQPFYISIGRFDSEGNPTLSEMDPLKSVTLEANNDSREYQPNVLICQRGARVDTTESVTYVREGSRWFQVAGTTRTEVDFKGIESARNDERNPKRAFYQQVYADVFENCSVISYAPTGDPQQFVGVPEEGETVQSRPTSTPPLRQQPPSDDRSLSGSPPPKTDSTPRSDGLQPKPQPTVSGISAPIDPDAAAKTKLKDEITKQIKAIHTGPKLDINAPQLLAISRDYQLVRNDVTSLENCSVPELQSVLALATELAGSSTVTSSVLSAGHRDNVGVSQTRQVGGVHLTGLANPRVACFMNTGIQFAADVLRANLPQPQHGLYDMVGFFNQQITDRQAEDNLLDQENRMLAASQQPDRARMKEIAVRRRELDSEQTRLKVFRGSGGPTKLQNFMNGRALNPAESASLRANLNTLMGLDRSRDFPMQSPGVPRDQCDASEYTLRLLDLFGMTDVSTTTTVTKSKSGKLPETSTRSEVMKSFEIEIFDHVRDSSGGLISDGGKYRKRQVATNVSDGVRRMFAPENLRGDEGRLDMQAGGKSDSATKQLSASTLPQTIVVTLKRFDMKPMRPGQPREQEKIRYNVNVDDVRIRRGDQDVTFEPVGVMLHQGDEPNGGHYNYLTKKGGQWCLINDRSVTDVSERDAKLMMAQMGYQVLYRQRPTAPQSTGVTGVTGVVSPGVTGLTSPGVIDEGRRSVSPLPKTDSLTPPSDGIQPKPQATVSDVSVPIDPDAAAKTKLKDQIGVKIEAIRTGAQLDINASNLLTMSRDYQLVDDDVTSLENCSVSELEFVLELATELASSSTTPSSFSKPGHLDVGDSQTRQVGGVHLNGLANPGVACFMNTGIQFAADVLRANLPQPRGGQYDLVNFFHDQITARQNEYQQLDEEYEKLDAVKLPEQRDTAAMKRIDLRRTELQSEFGRLTEFSSAGGPEQLQNFMNGQMLKADEGASLRAKLNTLMGLDDSPDFPMTSPGVPSRQCDASEYTLRLLDLFGMTEVSTSTRLTKSKTAGQSEISDSREVMKSFEIEIFDHERTAEGEKILNGETFRKNQTARNVSEGVRKMFQSETLIGDARHLDMEVGGKSDSATKQLSVSGSSELPQTIVVTLKRFDVKPPKPSQNPDQPNQPEPEKIRYNVSVDDVTIRHGNRDVIFEPVGVMLHRGDRPTGGHYMYLTKKGEQWCLMDDRGIKDVSEAGAKRMMARLGYQVLYRQKGS